MAKKTAASLKRLNQANLEALGVERLAALLIELGERQPALKRRLRMELAAEVGAGDLAAEVDKRLATLAGSRARVSWRKRAEFIGDLDVLRAMIAGRLAALDPDAALTRLLALFDLARPLSNRVRDTKGELDAVFAEAAADLGRVVAAATGHPEVVARELADAIERIGPMRWAEWLPVAVEGFPGRVSAALLRLVREAGAPSAPRGRLVGALADAAGDVDAWLAGLTPADLRTLEFGVGAARRLLAAGRVQPALKALTACDPNGAGRERAVWTRGAGGPVQRGRDEWEATAIAALEADGQAEAARAARWRAFERTLAPDHLRAIVARLADFDDVEAVDKAMAHAARHPDFTAALRLMIDWPAPAEAAALVLARAADIDGSVPELPAWASRLEARHPLAALLLLRAAVLAAPPDRPGEAVEADLSHAEALAARAGDLRGAPTHERFLVEVARSRARRR